MKETTRFDAGFQAEGRVCVQYTDTTGRVREEIRGKNHVYVDQMMTTNWINDIMVNVPLVLTNSRRPVDTTFPYVPGEIIGYGVPGSSGTDAYFGSFRGNESYRALRTRTSCSSKFIYDFSPTQALGTLGHVGLSFQPKLNIAYATMIKPGKPYANYPINSSSTTYSSKKILIGDNLYQSDGVNGSRIYKWDVFTEFNNRKLIDISGLLTIPDGYETYSYDFIGYNCETGNVCLLVFYRMKNADNTYTYIQTLYELDETLESVVSSTSLYIPSIPNTNAFGRYGNKLYFLPQDNQSGNYMNMIICSDIETGEKTNITAKGAFGKNLGGNGVISFYKNFMGCASRGDLKNGCGFVFDLEQGELYAQMLGSEMDYMGTRCCFVRHAASTCGGLLQFEYANVNSYTHPYGGAITDYRMPDDAPERPEGYGMTVIYELNVLW